MAYGQINAEQLTTQSGYTLGAGNASSFKNRIINGNMVIDQRNAGASVSANGSGVKAYATDRFYIERSININTLTGQQVNTAPTGFIKSFQVTANATTSAPGATDYARMVHAIEGFNVADLGWGTASAQSITMSFWVRGSITGTYGVGLSNASANRSYVASYTINAANTWEQKTITIAGDTSGTWATDNTAGIFIQWDLGVGTTYSTTAGSWSGSYYFGLTGGVKLITNSSATFYITGVQLEVGTVATSFDYRDYGREFYLCQRYFQKLSYVASQMISVGGAFTGANASAGIYFPQELRATPSITLPSAGQAGATITFLNGAGSYPTSTGSHAALDINNRCFTVAGSGYTGLTSGQPAWLYPSAALSILVSAEL